MLVKNVESSAVPGGRALCLCDNEGNRLPMQTRCIFEQTVGDASQITVTFLIDGEQVRLA